MSSAPHGKPLSSLVSGLDVQSLRGPTEVRVAGLRCDSRDVTPGDLFFAHPGQHTDGHLYAAEAIRRGAAAVVHSRDLASYEDAKTYIKVMDTYRAASTVADAFFDRPSAALAVIGVTGTDGKSSTVWFLYQLLTMLGVKTGFLSTVWIDLGRGVRKNPLRKSTPESMEVQSFLAQMRDNGCACAVVEATSHGLSDRYSRLAHVAFDVGIMTNVTHEHLEFHGSFERYRSDKANLFRRLGRTRKGTAVRRSCRAPLPAPPPCFGVVNADDPSAGYFAQATDRPTYSFSVGASCPAANRAGAGADPAAGAAAAHPDMSAARVQSGLNGSRFRLRCGEETLDARTVLPGSYNVANLLAATLTVCRLLSLPAGRVVPLYGRLRGVRGRMEMLDLGQPFRVIVDYAHTPESFEKVLSLVRPMTPGRLITVFGSAGERDLEKRPRQGEVASRWADIVILTDEDPRQEDRMKILREIAAGCGDRIVDESLLLMPDRREAIRKALMLAEPGDTVLCLGKGHEQSIIYPDGPIPWDEVEITRELLEHVLNGSGHGGEPADSRASAAGPGPTSDRRK